MQIHTDTIVRTDVRDALRHLSRDRTPGRTPLSRLQVVERAVARSGMRPSSGAREYELARLLAETVEMELARLRTTLRSGEPGDGSDILDTLRCDFGAGHRELESWSAVYHLYVRPDLNLDLDVMQEVLGDRHRRTLQRRLQQGVTALSMHLQSMERTAVTATRRERLVRQLPDRTRTWLIGRGEAVSRVRELLAEDLAGHVVAIGGPGGVGKTALAWSVALAEIDAENVADVVWLKLNASGDGGSRIHDEGDPADLWDRALCMTTETDGPRPTLVVIDGIDVPEAAAEAVATVGSLRPNARVLLTGRVGWPCCDKVRPVKLEPLGRTRGLALLKRLAAERGLQDVARTRDELLEPLVEATGGLPRALCLAAARLRAIDAAQVATELASGDGSTGDLCADLWEPAWLSATNTARTAVRGVSSLTATRGDADFAAIRAVTRLSRGEAAAALQEAVDLGLLDVSGDASHRTFRTWPFLRRYLAATASLEER